MAENLTTAFVGRAITEYDPIARKNSKKSVFSRIEKGIELIEECPLNATSFYKTKVMSAAESADYFLRQRRRLLTNGSIENDNKHWRLLNQRLDQLLRLFQKLANQSEGYVFYCQDHYPLVTLWLLLNLKSDQMADLIPTIEDIFTQVDVNHWRQEIALSQSPHIDQELMICCLSQQEELALQSYKALVERRSLDAMASYSLISHAELSLSIRARIHSHRAIHLDDNSKAWLIEQDDELTDWYVQLFSHSTPSHWWLEAKSKLEGGMPYWLYIVIDMLLTPNRDSDVEIKGKNGPLVFALSGDKNVVADVIVNLYQDMDEPDFNLWLSALAFVFGKQLPFDIADYGMKLDRVALVTKLTNWWQPNNWPTKIRSGKALNYQSTLSVLRNPRVCSQMRKVAWYDLCISSRTYIQYSCYEYPDIQRSVLNRLENDKEATTRFELRKKHGIVEH